MALNLHHLRLFAAVVDHGGFTQGGRALHLSQPAISKSLNELERQLDVTLIDRTGRSIRSPTPGKTLYARARELFGVERAAEQELRELRGLKRGVLAGRRQHHDRDLSASRRTSVASICGIPASESTLRAPTPAPCSACSSSFGWTSLWSRVRYRTRASTSCPGRTTSWS